MSIMSRLRDYLPKGIYRRSLVIVVAPIVLFQIILTYLFMERHWQSVTQRLSRNVAAEIALLVESYQLDPLGAEAKNLATLAQQTLQLSINFMPGEVLQREPGPGAGTLVHQTLSEELATYLDRPLWIDSETYPKHVEVHIQFDESVMRILAPRSHVFATNWHVFLVWMVGASVILTTIAILFLRNQIRPIEQLAEAAEHFGIGQEIPDFKPTGAAEVRRAAQAFVEMRDRIQRQIQQRTTMLAGVSHDLRTPLTRFKLQLAVLGESPEIDALRRDVNEMEYMLEEYLDFARGEGGERKSETDLPALLDEIRANACLKGTDVRLETRDDLSVPLKRNAFRRCITNLVENACAQSQNVTISAHRHNGSVEVAVDDDGPGIPVELREDAFRPFYRLDDARNQDRTGTGLGLAIARDVARGHGGDVMLTDSPLGGLRALVHVPI